METVSRRHLLLAALGLAVTVLITLVVLAARSSSLQAGDGPANAGPVIAIVHLIEIVGIALELLAILILIVVFFRLSRRRDEDADDAPYQEPVRVHWLVRLLSSLLPLLVLTALIVAITRSRPVDQPIELAPVGDFGASPGSGGFAEQVVTNLGLSWWEVLIAVVLAVATFVGILRAFRAYRPPASTPEEEPEVARQTSALASAVGAGLRDARLEPDPRRAVITAYATMERMLAAQGWPRREVEAPLEYMTRLFAKRHVRADALATLTELFELARFSHHVISPATKERAIGALTVIDQELRAAR
jgi:heme/copper-type cytochrome/quinol oxidase subunit 2